MMSQLFVLVTLLFASQEAIGGSRVRFADARTAALADAGLARSATFRRLVADVQAGDVIVHVGIEPVMHGRQTGRMKLIVNEGPQRYVRIWIRGDLPSTPFIASLAHELQHVSELVANPEVRDAVALEHLYRRIGREYRRSGRQAFETDAALRIATEVRREINDRTLSTARIAMTTAR
jgi:hypothetical protein